MLISSTNQSGLVWSSLVSNKRDIFILCKPVGRFATRFTFLSMQFLEIQDSSPKPKYLQIADLIIAEIENGSLKLNDRLPSVNQISKTASVSRETVFNALNHLREKGIVQAANRQGYFVMNTDVSTHIRIFFLLDKFTTFKEELYHSFQQTIGEAGDVDIYFHHHNASLFRSLITENLPQYTHFVIVPFFKEDVSEILNQIPDSKRLILDNYEPNLDGEYGMVYQDFSGDIVQSLIGVEDRLSKYHRIVTIAPGSLYHAQSVIDGLDKFSQTTGFPTKILSSVDPSDYLKGDVYLTISGYDRELVEVIKLSRKHGYTIGKDIGIISYNDTPVKEVLEGGITVISTDFREMGKQAAQMLLDKKTQVIANPTQLILRNSL